MQNTKVETKTTQLKKLQETHSEGTRPHAFVTLHSKRVKNKTSVEVSYRKTFLED